MCKRVTFWNSMQPEVNMEKVVDKILKSGVVTQTVLGGLTTLWVKKLGQFYFYCNFGKCWSISIFLSLGDS